jgi:hypothetical protein
MAKRMRRAKFEEEADAAIAAHMAAMAEAEQHMSERIPVLLRLPRGVLEFYDHVASETGMSRNEVLTESLAYLMANMQESSDRTLGSPLGRFRRRVELLVGQLMQEIGEKAASAQLLEELSKRRATRHANEAAVSDRITE